MAYLLGIDVATTGTKALLIDEEGTVVASATKGYPLSTPRPLWSEQDPTDWWEETVASIRELLEASAVDPASIIGVGLTGQMQAGASRSERPSPPSRHPMERPTNRVPMRMDHRDRGV